MLVVVFCHVCSMQRGSKQADCAATMEAELNVCDIVSYCILSCTVYLISPNNKLDTSTMNYVLISGNPDISRWIPIFIYLFITAL